MINSEKIISKLERFFNFVNIDTFFKSIFIQFLIDKTNYLNKIFLYIIIPFIYFYTSS